MGMIRIIILTAIIAFTAGRVTEYRQSYDLTHTGRQVQSIQRYLERLPQ